MDIGRMGLPLVSVIIPTYRPEHLRETVESALAQTISDLEIIVVEDGSYTAPQALKECCGPVRYVWQENQGVSGARNTGIRHALGIWLAFLDHDDLWKPDKLQRQLLLAERCPEFKMIHTDYFVLREGQLYPGPRLVPVEQVPSRHVGRELFMNNFVINSSVLVTRKGRESAGGLDRRFRYAQDYDLWLRIARNHEIGFLNERLTVFRDHDYSLSNQHSQVLVDCAEVLSKFVSAYPAVWKEFGVNVIRSRMSTAYWDAAYSHFCNAEYAAARSLFSKAWQWDRSCLRPLLYGLACLTGQPGVRAMHAVRRVIT
jgi:glycosyltransferase involved in cell wall biosynthesis